MTFNLDIKVPSLGPPTFKSPLADINMKVNEVLSLKMPGVTDPDWEDGLAINSVEFGTAASFVTGKFPAFKLSPKNNDTCPATYEVKVTL